MNYEEIWNKIKDISQQHKEEFLWLLEIIHEKNYKAVLEIGSYKGGSALGFSMIGCNVTCVDKDPQPELITNLRDYDYTLFKEDSLGYILPEEWEFDVLHIDGGHTYEMCKADFENFENFVKPGGIIVFHDINPADGQNFYGSSIFWDELTKTTNHPFEEKVVKPESWGGIGVLYV